MTLLAKMNDLERLDKLMDWFSYEPDTGIVRWAKKPSRSIQIGAQAGFKVSSGRNTYIRIGFQGSYVFAHHVAFVIKHGRMPLGVIDHIDGDGTNNRAANLRDVSHTENLRNQRRGARNTSGFMGIDFHAASRRWRARIIVDQKERHLGMFDTRDAALEARKNAELIYGFHANHGRTGI